MSHPVTKEVLGPCCSPHGFLAEETHREDACVGPSLESKEAGGLNSSGWNVTALGCMYCHWLKMPSATAPPTTWLMSMLPSMLWSILTQDTY